jgi:hypothetical protein
VQQCSACLTEVSRGNSTACGGGLKNLQTHFREFDEVLLVKSFATNDQLDFKFHPYLKIENGKIKERAEQIPDWADKLVQNISVYQAQLLAEKQKSQRSLIQKKGRGSGEDLDHGYERAME